MANKLTKRLISLAAGVSILLGTYQYGKSQRPTLKELTPNAQATIVQDSKSAQELLRGAETAIRNKNYRAAIEKYQQARPLIDGLRKIDPAFGKIEQELDLVCHFLENVSEYMAFIGRYEKIEADILNGIKIGRVDINATILKNQIDLFNKIGFSAAEQVRVDRSLANTMYSINADLIADYRAKVVTTIWRVEETKMTPAVAASFQGQAYDAKGEMIRFLREVVDILNRFEAAEKSAIR